MNGVMSAKDKRDKYIEVAAAQTYMLDPAYRHNKRDYDIAVRAFMCGAHWSDNNPISAWVSVEEQLPPINEMFFAAYANGDMRIKYFTDEDDRAEYLEEDKWFTHWMPMPKPPKGGAK